MGDITEESGSVEPEEDETPEELPEDVAPVDAPPPEEFEESADNPEGTGEKED